MDPQPLTPRSAPPFPPLPSTGSGRWLLSREAQPGAWSDEFSRGAAIGRFQGAEGKHLFFQAFRHSDPVRERGAVVLVNGRTETCRKYAELAFDLYRNGYSVYAYDHRGQGLSPRLLPGDPEKGHVERFEHYVTDLGRFVDRVVDRGGHRRRFLLGHSLGGCIVSLFLEGGPPGFHAAALTSPMHAPRAGGARTRRWVCAAAKRAPRAWRSRYVPGTGPWRKKWAPFEGNPLTHSRIRFDRWRDLCENHPALRIGGPTIRWLAEACRWSETARRRAADIRIPVLLLQAGADTVVCPQAQERFAAAMASGCRAACTAYRLPGARHELLIESDRWRTPAVAAILDFFTGPKKA